MKTLREQLKDEGFTLIELLIVMSIMLILIALAVPQYRSVKKKTNETSARASLHAISSAQKQYDSSYGDIGYACTLPSLGGDPSSGAPSAQGAQMLDPKLASTQVKDGYTFNITCKKTPVGNTERVTGYDITAVPITVGSTGDNGFCMDDNDGIKLDPAGGTNCTAAPAAAK